MGELSATGPGSADSLPGSADTFFLPRLGRSGHVGEFCLLFPGSEYKLKGHKDLLNHQAREGKGHLSLFCWTPTEKRRHSSFPNSPFCQIKFLMDCSAELVSGSQFSLWWWAVCLQAYAGVCGQLRGCDRGLNLPVRSQPFMLTGAMLRERCMWQRRGKEVVTVYLYVHVSVFIDIFTKHLPYLR